MKRHLTASDSWPYKKFKADTSNSFFQPVQPSTVTDQATSLNTTTNQLIPNQNFWHLGYDQPQIPSSFPVQRKTPAIPNIVNDTLHKYQPSQRLEKLIDDSHVEELKAAVKNNQIDTVDRLLEKFPWSDADIDSLFWFAFRSNATEIQKYLLDSKRNYFYSVVLKPYEYLINVIPVLNDKKLSGSHILNIKQKNNPTSVLLLVYEQKYSLGFSSPQGYKEVELTKQAHINFIQMLLQKYPNKFIFSTKGAQTREFRNILLSVGGDIFSQYNPKALADSVIWYNHHLEKYGLFCDCNSSFKAEIFFGKGFAVLQLFLQNEYFDPTVNNNFLLRSLIENNIFIPPSALLVLEDKRVFESKTTQQWSEFFRRNCMRTNSLIKLIWETKAKLFKQAQYTGCFFLPKEISEKIEATLFEMESKTKRDIIRHYNY